MYHRETLDLRRRDPVHGQFGVLIRAERYERYKAAMEAGRLRRERLTLFFSRVIDTKVPIAGDRAVAEYFNSLSKKESLAIADFADKPLSGITASDIATYRDARLKENVAGGTLGQYIKDV